MKLLKLFNYNDKETLEETLRREVLEEVGFKIEGEIKPLGYIEQSYTDRFKEDTCFFQTSYYYICNIGNEYTEINITESEKELGLISKWVKLEEAIKVNENKIKGNNNQPWTERELYVMNLLKNKY